MAVLVYFTIWALILIFSSSWKLVLIGWTQYISVPLCWEHELKTLCFSWEKCSYQVEKDFFPCMSVALNSNFFLSFFSSIWRWIWSCLALGYNRRSWDRAFVISWCAGSHSGSWCAISSAHWGWDNWQDPETVLPGGPILLLDHIDEKACLVCPDVPPPQPFANIHLLPSMLMDVRDLPWQPPGFTFTLLEVLHILACSMIYQAVILHCLVCEQVISNIVLRFSVLYILLCISEAISENAK